MVLEQFLFLKLDFWQCFIKEYQWPECMGPWVGWIDFPPYSPYRGIQKRRPRWRQRKNCRPQLLIIWFWLTSKPVWCRNKYRGFIFCALMACYLAGRGKARLMKSSIFNFFTCTFFYFKDQKTKQWEMCIPCLLMIFKPFTLILWKPEQKRQSRPSQYTCDYNV